MISRNKGFNRVELRWRFDHGAEKYRLYRLDDAGGRKMLLSSQRSNAYVDTVPVSLNCKSYFYELEVVYDENVKLEKVETSRTDWCRDMLPAIHVPNRPGWEAIYQKAWQLTWESIVTSEALPSRFAYNDYPDNDTTYVWDSCFCSLFQRYASIQGVHPCMKTLDNFYALQQQNGYIPRNYWTKTFESWYSLTEPTFESVNPPLFAWAEWGHYMMTADKERLEDVLPHLMLHYEFVDSTFKKDNGLYRWNAGGSGWDNINWEQGEDAIHWYVDMYAQQALAARCIANIAGALGKEDVERQYTGRWEEKRKKLLRLHWNDAAKWFCSRTKDSRFTRKTLSGIWPMAAGLVEHECAEELVKKTLLNSHCFMTDPMPLPTVAKDENGYNPLGEYWLGGVWINMSYLVIRTLYENGFQEEAFALAIKTLDGVYDTYEKFESFPQSLWECYAPEASGPASHKITAPDKLGGVREEFGGWACNIINILIENVLGFYVNAPENALVWDIKLFEEHGIRNLHFGSICTSLNIKFEEHTKEISELIAKSNGEYRLIVRHNGNKKEIKVKKGINYI